MYSTIIRQQHIIDRIEQERLLLSFNAQKYYKTKAAQSASHAQNDALETTQSQHTALRVIEKNSTEGRDIDAKCIKFVC